MMPSRAKPSRALFLTVPVLAATAAHADLIEVAGSGTIGNSQQPNVLFRFVYDTEAEPDFFSQFFDDADTYPVVEAFFQIGTWSTTRADLVTLNVWDGYNDIDRIGFSFSDELVGDPIDRRRFDVNLIDPTRTALSGTTPPHPDDFSFEDFGQRNGNFRSWNGINEPGYFRNTFDIEFILFRVIPAPGTAAALPLALLAAPRRRRPGAYRHA
jgi:hypothetical protein